MPDGDHARELYDLTGEVCAAAGLPAYEISNYARPGAACRHNLVYWRYHEYAGIGPGAHGRLDIDGRRHATATEKRPEAWLMRVEASGTGVVTDEALSRVEAADEFLLMGLRLAEGIDLARFTALAGRAAGGEADRRVVDAWPRRDDARRPPARHRGGISRCSTRSSPISRRSAPQPLGHGHTHSQLGPPAVRLLRKIAKNVTVSGQKGQSKQSRRRDYR